MPRRAAKTFKYQHVSASSVSTNNINFYLTHSHAKSYLNKMDIDSV